MDCSSQTAIRQGQRSHSQGRYKRCQTWQHHRGKEVQFHGGKMGYGPDLLREGQTRRDCEVWDHIATTQDKSNDPKHQRTTAERSTLGRLEDSTIRQNRRFRRSTDAHRIFFSLSINPGTFSRGLETMVQLVPHHLLFWTHGATGHGTNEAHRISVFFKLFWGLLLCSAVHVPEIIIQNRSSGREVSTPTESNTHII